LKVGGQNVIRERSEQKKFFCAPTFGKVGGTIFYTWGTSTEMSIIIKYTEICCLVVALIHIGLS